MLLKPNTTVYVLTPTMHLISNDDSFSSVGTVHFNKMEYEVYLFTVHSNIKLHCLENGIDQSDFTHNLGTGN